LYLRSAEIFGQFPFDLLIAISIPDPEWDQTKNSIGVVSSHTKVSSSSDRGSYGRHCSKTAGRDSEFPPVIFRRNVGEEEHKDPLTCALLVIQNYRRQTLNSQRSTDRASPPLLGTLMDPFTDSIIDRKSKKHGWRKRR